MSNNVKTKRYTTLLASNVYNNANFHGVKQALKMKFVDALWSPAGKGLTSWLSFVMSNCDVVIFPLVSWVRCGA